MSKKSESGNHQNSPSEAQIVSDFQEILSYQDFLSIYQQAMRLCDQKALSHLKHLYPDFYAEAYIQMIPPCPNLEQSQTTYPILELPAGYSPCVLNMITYLTGDPKTACLYIDSLFEHVKNEKRRNIRTDQVCHIFDETSLWNDFFTKEPSLAAVLCKRKIESFQELVLRTQNYFENADPLCALQNQII